MIIETSIRAVKVILLIWKWHTVKKQITGSSATISPYSSLCNDHLNR